MTSEPRPAAAVGGVHHVSLNVADNEAAVRFYEDVLGFRRLERPDFGFPGAWLDTGNGQVHLLEVPDHRAPAGQHVAFQVDDIEAARSAVLAHGVEVSEASPVGTGLQAFLHDPSGNLIELNQPQAP